MKLTIAKALTIFSATVTALSLLLAGQFVHAAQLKTETTSKKFENVKLIKSVTLQNDDQTESQMTAVSYGLRKKAIFGLVPLNIYVAQLLVTNPTKLVKTEEGFLTSLKEAGPIQLHLTFLKNLPGEKISDSFKDGLEANNIDVKKLPPPLEKVLQEVAAVGEFKEGDNFSITVNWTADKAIVYLTDAKLKMKTIMDSKDFADQLLSIWFGKTTDAKLADLKKSLIK